jgi:hypothetical protein
LGCTIVEPIIAVVSSLASSTYTRWREKSVATYAFASGLVTVGVQIVLGAFLATLDSSTGRFNFNGFDLGKAADYAVAHEAVLAGAGESRLQVGASCIRMACGGVVGALVQVATGERTVLVGDRAVDPSLLGLASAMILAP